LIFVLDASITLNWCFEDEKSRYSEAVLNSFMTHTAIVPLLWPVEVVNALLIGERRDRLTAPNSIRFLDQLQQLPIQVEGVMDISTSEKLLSLGREYNLTSYDALYLSLALQKDCPLATDDKAIRKACRKVGVELYKP